MKKAILVTFEIKTRVIVDADYDNATLANLDWEVAKIAADKLKRYPNAYLDEENMTEVAIDMECPYDPDYDKVDLHIPSSQEMIDFIKTNSKIITAYVNGNEISFPSEELAMDNPIELNNGCWIDSIKIVDDKYVKIHFGNPTLKNLGISVADWNDIAMDVKVKIMKAIGYED